MKFKKTIFLTIIFASIVIMSGCSQSKIIENYAGYQNDSDYENYEKLRDNSKLDSNGYYYTDDISETNDYSTDTNGKIHITFAENSYLKINYYSDSKMENDSLINTKDCYLLPGTTIYAKIENEINPNSNLYKFSKFIIHEYDSSGALVSDFSYESSLENGVVFVLPYLSNNNGYSVLPIGKFENRVIKFSAYYLDKNKMKQQISDVKWYVDDKEVESEISLDLVNSYTVSCDFSNIADSYYFEDSSPKYYNFDDDSNIVKFYQKSSVDETVNYEVKLHQYMKIIISNSNSFFNKLWDKVTDSEAIVSISVNGEDEKVNFTDNEISKIKVGDKITITVSEGYEIFSNDITVGNGIPVENGVKYSITITESKKSNINITSKEKG